jgi:branched-chain amino acid transport system substrate-binding protein
MSARTKNTILGIIATVLVLLVVYITVVPRKDSSGKVRVASLLILTGEYQSYGEQFRDGATLAARQQTGIELVFYDTQGEKGKAVDLVKTLHDRDGIMYLADIMGTPLVRESSEAFKERKMLVVSGVNTGPDLPRKGGGFFFRIIPSDAVAAQQLVRWALEMNLRRAAVVYDTDEWGSGLRGEIEAGFPSAGGTILGTADCSKGFQLFSPLVARIKAMNPDVVFLVVYPREAGLFLKEAARQGLSARYMGTDNFTGDELKQQAGGSLKDVLFVVPGDEVRPPEYETFAQLFQRTYGKEPGLFSVMGYDVVNIVADVTSRFKRDTLAAARYLRSTTYRGASGTIMFTESGDRRVLQDYRRMVYRRRAPGSFEAVPFTGDGAPNGVSGRNE